MIASANTSTFFAAIGCNRAAIDGDRTFWKGFGIVSIWIIASAYAGTVFAACDVEFATMYSDGSAVVARAAADTCRIVITVGYYEPAFMVAVTLAVDNDGGVVVFFHLQSTGECQRGIVGEDEVYLTENIQRLVRDVALHHIVVVFLAAITQLLPVVGMGTGQQYAHLCHLFRIQTLGLFIPRAFIVVGNDTYLHFAIKHLRDLVAVVAVNEYTVGSSGIVLPEILSDSTRVFGDAHANLCRTKAFLQSPRHGDEGLAVQIDVVSVFALLVVPDIDIALHVERAVAVVEDAGAAVGTGVSGDSAALD